MSTVPATVRCLRPVESCIPIAPCLSGYPFPASSCQSLSCDRLSNNFLTSHSAAAMLDLTTLPPPLQR